MIQHLLKAYRMHLEDPLNGSVSGYYIVSTAIKEGINVGQNYSIAKRKFWAQTGPLITTASLNPPFTGCIFFLQAALGSSLIDGNPSNIPFRKVPQVIANRRYSKLSGQMSQRCLTLPSSITSVPVSRCWRYFEHHD